MIEFPRGLYDEIVKQAYQGDDTEICGILGGRYRTDHSVVESIHETTNVADVSEVRYYIDPEEQFEITETIEEAGEGVVGFYHSHPAGPTQPSETDAERATWPGHSYVIVALDGYPYVGSWRWLEDEGFEQELLTVADRR